MTGPRKPVSTTADKAGRSVHFALVEGQAGRGQPRAKKTSSTGPSSGPAGRRGPTCAPSPSDQGGNKGCGLFLDSVQFLKPGKRLDGRKAASESFPDDADAEEMV